MADLVQSFKLALYYTKKSVKPTSYDVTWEAVQEFLTGFEESPCTVENCAGKGKGNQPGCQHKYTSKLPENPMCWSPVEIYGERANTNVKAITALSLDFDGLTQQTAAAPIASLSRFECIFHTTHSHRDNNFAFRAVLRLSRRVNANQWRRFWDCAVAYLGVEATRDPSAKDPARMYYRPSHPQGAPHFAKCVSGPVLDVDTVLTWGEQHVPREPAREVTSELPETSVSWDLNSATVKAAILAGAQAFPSTRRNEFCLALAGMLRGRGVTEEDAEYVVHEIASRGGSTDADARAKTVQHTYRLPADAMMTGFSTVCEIVGDVAAEGIGELFTLACNETLLRNASRKALAQSQAQSQSNGTVTHGVRVPVISEEVIDAADAKKKLLALAARKASASEYDEKVAAVLLRRTFQGHAIATIDGVGDLDSALEGKNIGTKLTDALKTVFGSIAFTLPPRTPWSVVLEITRKSLIATGNDAEKIAERIFVQAQVARTVQDLQHIEDVKKQQAVVRGATTYSTNPPPDGSSWQDDLQKDGKGEVAQNDFNVGIVLRNHPDFAGHIRLNLVSKRVEIHGGPLVAKRDNDNFDSMAVNVKDFLTGAHNLTIPYQDVMRRVYKAARENAYDPIADHLRSLKWDGVERLETWLTDYAGALAEDEAERAYINTIGKRWMIAAAARALEPGCKCDTMLILESEKQGVGKSTLFDVLGGKWFCDTPIDLQSKDSRMLIGSNWIFEIAELQGFRSADDDRRKAFLSQRVDKLRLPYGRDTEDFPRRGIFAGTTNKQHYLTDDTGHRRYWSVLVTKIKLGELRRDRDQLFAEAAHLFLAAETCPICATLRMRDTATRCDEHKWWLSKAEDEVAESQASKREEETPFVLKIQEWWTGQEPAKRPRQFTTDDLAISVLGFEETRLDHRVRMQVGGAVKKLGFKKTRIMVGTVRHWFYVPTAAQLNEPQVKPAEKIKPRAGGFASNILTLPVVKN